MAIPTERLGARFETPPTIIDGERTKAYALATNDRNPAYASGQLAPPVYGVVPTRDAMVAAMDNVIPKESQKHLMHAERDMHFHRPLVPGMRLTSVSDAYCWRVGSSGTRYTLRINSVDDDKRLVLEQYATMFVESMSDGESQGPDKPEHHFDEEARERLIRTHSVHVDADQTVRYRDASGDELHRDDDGLAILHGMCTMAMNGQSVIETVGGGDPTKLRRLAVGWAKPVFPGHDLITSIYDVGELDGRRRYCFETTSNGVTVVTNGWAEILDD
jgi:acyl dehydratase